MTRRVDTNLYESSFFIIFKGILTIALLCFGVYFAYFHLYLGYKFSRTGDDLVTLNRNIQAIYKGVYKNLDTQSAYLNQLVSPSVKAERNENGITLYNNFGGNIIIMESLNSGRERSLYYGLRTDKQKYKELYPGVTAYLVMFTNLSKGICRMFAQSDWKVQLPNFIGIEVSSIPSNKIYQGFSKLNISFIDDDKENDKYYVTKDEGIVSQYPLRPDAAKEACDCSGNTCSVALKLR